MKTNRLLILSIISLFAVLCVPGRATITIGQGPAIGTDHAGNTYYEEFQDWSYSDLRALDPCGQADTMYLYVDGYDNSRDITAFYSRQEGANYYFRADFYDLHLMQRMDI